MSLRQIILLRHAHAEPAIGDQPDPARPLTADGHNEASAAADWLLAQQLRPERIVCSPALRTRQTVTPLSRQLGESTVVTLDERVYEATPASLIEILDEYSDTPCIVLVGHNPGLEGLLSLLTDGSSAGGRGMPPGSIAWLSIDSGKALEPGATTLHHFWSP
ncbi:MAG: histidine phosphatase family protein [Dokdonella sp.]